MKIKNLQRRPHRSEKQGHGLTAVSLALLLMLRSCWPAVAAESEITDTTHGWGKTALDLGAGVLAAYAIHEGAHWAAAGLTGTDLHWESGTYNQPLGFTEDADRDSDGAVLHGAGLVGQALCGEVILAMDGIDKTSNFVRGIMLWNVVNPVIYAVDYWFLHSSNRIDEDGYQGDLAGVEHYAGEDAANTFAAATAALALWQGYRFWRAQDKAPTTASGNIQLGIVPTSKGGAMFSLKLDF